jgi:hypothetical protein
MANNHLLKILFNTVFVVVFSIVTLNACQDTGGKTPINKSKPGKNGDQKPGGTPTVSPRASPTSVRPSVTGIDGNSSADLNTDDYNSDRTRIEDSELESLVRLVDEVNHDYQDAWAVSIKKPKNQVANIFEHVKTNLKSKSLIRKIEDKTASCVNKPFYVFKQKNSKYDSKVLFAFGNYDCSSQQELDFMVIEFDSAASSYNLAWNYNATHDFNKADILQVMFGLKPDCKVNWNVSEQKIEKIICTDVGQNIELADYKKSVRVLKNITIEGTNRVLNLEWVDYGIKDKEEAREIEGSRKTAEKIGENNIYICPPPKERPILDCKQYFETCDANSVKKADPVCGNEESAKSEDKSAEEVPKKDDDTSKPPAAGSQEAAPATQTESTTQGVPEGSVEDDSQNATPQQGAQQAEDQKNGSKSLSDQQAADYGADNVQAENVNLDPTQSVRPTVAPYQR